MPEVNLPQQRRPHCLVTKAKLPKFIDHAQQPRKKRPFATLLGGSLSCNLDLLLPEAAGQRLHNQLAQAGHDTLHYAKLYMKLLDIISGDFFNTFIKTPSAGPGIIMLSEGRPGIDHVFSLRHGILRLEVDKTTFEQLGLPGKSVPDHGVKHVASHYAVEVNLRLPNMVRGKPGFMRLVRACENVLNRTLTWLLCNEAGVALDKAESLEQQQQCIMRSAKPSMTALNDICVPESMRDVSESDDTEAAEILEWLTMAFCASPRLRKNDDMDTLLSRYRRPGQLDSEETGSEDLLVLSWSGPIPPEFAHKVFLEAMKASASQWFAISSSAFSGEAYTILAHHDHAVTWEYGN